MIVSASYKTDIPAFYGRWFLNRLRAGWCEVVNPYGGGIHRVDLTQPAVDGFVFWTRNPGPFLEALDAVRGGGWPFVVQMTITGYPRPLEPGVLDAQAAVGLFRRLAEVYGPRALVWRYDPILVADPMPPGWHRANFARLAAALRGSTDEAVVSFAQPYRKTVRNLEAAGRRHGFAWRDPEAEEKRTLLADLAGLAAEQGMALTLCTQPELAGVPGTGAARCIDADRLSDVAGRPLKARQKGNRPGCLCAESRDIGAYDSCLQGCAYCYAVTVREGARRNQRAHDPADPLLIPRRTAAIRA